MPPTLTTRRPRRDMEPIVLVSGQDLCGDAFTERTHALNVSGSGLCFVTAHNLSVGTRLSLKILIPRGLQKRFGYHPIYPVRAMVCRVEHPPGHDFFRVGARMLAPANR